ncbi:MAG TPA: glycosyltransferase [Prevotellaceae bacterium]|nr:glycosyltransferase [Prevotellaceae bacterium]
MNILFIEREFMPTLGGVERVTYTLGERLRKDGHNTYYAFYGRDDSELAIDFKFHFDINWTDDKLYKSLKDYINTKNINIIVCQNIHIPRFQYLYKRLKTDTNIKIITCLHCNPDIWVNKNKYGCTFSNIYFKELLRSIYFNVIKNPYKVNQKGMYDLSDKYVLLSESFKKIFCKLNTVDGNKLYAIPNPCPFKDNYNFETTKENIVLVVSRMSEQQKRISNVINIWSLVSHKFLDWELVIVGDGPDLNRYKHLSQKLGTERIKFVGRSNNPQQYYKKAKIFMMTSIWEGLPMTLIEAQHYGCVPVAYNSFSAINDMIKNNKDGYIVPLHNQNMFAEKLCFLIRNQNLWKEMSDSAKLNSNALYNEDHIINLWSKLFTNL